MYIHKHGKSIHCPCVIRNLVICEAEQLSMNFVKRCAHVDSKCLSSWMAWKTLLEHFYINNNPCQLNINDQIQSRTNTYNCCKFTHHYDYMILSIANYIHVK